MIKLLCIRRNEHSREGEWWVAEDDGEPLYRARAQWSRKGLKLVTVSRVGLPWDFLAPYCIEPGFRVPQSVIDQRNPRTIVEEAGGLATTRQIEGFRKSAEDIIEPEFERRGRLQNPTPRERSERVRRGRYQKPDLEDPDAP